MPLSTAQVHSLLDTLLATNAYLALSTADPGDDGSGLAEPSGGSYARVDIVSVWAAAASRAKTTNAEIAFPAATGSWGEITHWAIMDASAAGNLKWKGAFATPKTVDSGETFKVASGQLTLSLPGS